MHLIKVRQRRHIVCSIQGSCGTCKAVHQLFRILQQFTPFFQLCILPRMKSCPLDLLNLVPQHLCAPQLLTLIHAQPRNLVVQFHPCRIGALIRAQLRLVGGVQIQKGQMTALIKKLLGIVLTMDADQLAAELAQNRNRNAAPLTRQMFFPSA